MSKPSVLKITEIKESPVALRAVNQESDAFLEMVESVKSKGILNPPSVRPLSEGGYCLVDGLHRYCAAKAAGLAEIPVLILDITETEALEAQVVANIQKVETRPVEYARQLKRILATNPTMTLSELAQKVSKSSAWISDRFGLLRLGPEIQDLVDNGELGLSNAYALSKLPDAEHANFIDRAMQLPPAEFLPMIEARQKEIRQAQREGKDTAEEAFTPVPHIRKMGEIKDEYANAQIGPKVIKAANIKDPVAAFAYAVKWVLKMDDSSIEEAKAKYEARKKSLDEAKARRETERAEKKATVATEKAAKLQEEAKAAAAAANVKLGKVV